MNALRHGLAAATIAGADGHAPTDDSSVDAMCQRLRQIEGTHTGKAAGLSQARERWRVYDVAREVQAAC